MRERAEDFHEYIGRLFPDQERKVRPVTLQVTDDCNLRCTYCYQINKGTHIMAPETAKRFLNLLLEDKNPYINTGNTCGMILEFIGGEPFLAIDVIEELTAWTLRRMLELEHPWLTKFRISICSNGVLYFQPDVQRYLQKYRPYISFSVSIDGNRALHDACRVFPDGSGSYDLAVAAAKHWMAHGGGMGSKMTLCPENVAYTAEALKNLIALGYRTIFCNCVFEAEWTLADARTLYRQLVELTGWMESQGLLDEIYISIFDETAFRPLTEQDNENWCGGTGDMIALDWKGNIYPCLRYMESSLGDSVPPLIIGTTDGGIEATEEQRHIVNCLKCVTRRSQSSDECWRCPIAKGCAWCSAYNYQATGSPDIRVTNICIMHRARAMANLYYWQRHAAATGTPMQMENHIPPEWAEEVLADPCGGRR